MVRFAASTLLLGLLCSVGGAEPPLSASDAPAGWKRISFAEATGQEWIFGALDLEFIIPTDYIIDSSDDDIDRTFWGVEADLERFRRTGSIKPRKLKRGAFLLTFPSLEVAYDWNTEEFTEEITLPDEGSKFPNSSARLVRKERRSIGEYPVLLIEVVRRGKHHTYFCFIGNPQNDAVLIIDYWAPYGESHESIWSQFTTAIRQVPLRFFM